MGRCLPWGALIPQNEKQSNFAGFRLKNKISTFLIKDNMKLDELKADIAKSETKVLKERYAMYRDLRSMGITDIVVRDLLELELARRGEFEDFGPYSTINS